MEVINKPKINYPKKSLQFFFHDRRKVISAVVILSLPFLNQLWRLAPEGIEISYYESFDIFVWNFCLNFTFVMISLAWYFSVPKKDQVLQFLSLLSAGYGIYLTFGTLPLADETPLWIDISSSAVILACLYFCLQYIQKNYLDKPNDYKALHDGLVYDLHHQRFLGSINRIAGLLEIAEMDEPYKCLCTEEIDELKKSIAYIAEKYETLN